MEEADLLKERLQAITDKRRIQEDIAKKRREIEEEKLKLQYIKKKALREHWLMDGLSQQSEEEQEAMRLQAQDEQQQSDQLQTSISRIEKELEALEEQELNISANEEIVLKRLKEVERTAEDIIKELNEEFQSDKMRHAPPALPEVLTFIPRTPAQSPPTCQPGGEELKRATFAMEISVEHDKRTGKSQVVSTATVSPEIIQQRGMKVYDDGRKVVYALNPEGGKTHTEAVGEMTPREVDELLRQATDETVPSEVQYHQPVYSAAYGGTSRPSTPRTPNRAQRQTPTHSPSSLQSATSSRDGVDSQLSQELEGLNIHSNTPSPNFTQPDSTIAVQRYAEETKQSNFHIPGQSKGDKPFIPPLCPPHLSPKTPRGPANNMDVSTANQAALVSIKVRSEDVSAPVQPVYMNIDRERPSTADLRPGDDPEASMGSRPTRPVQMEPEPVTMIFMGYENADEEEEDFQAELVVVGNSDDDDDDDNDDVEDEAEYVPNREECLSFHPEGYKSKVFQPKVGVANVTGCRDIIENAYNNWDDFGLHKPTFIHKPGKQSANMQRRGTNGSANKSNINMEKLALFNRKIR